MTLQLQLKICEGSLVILVALLQSKAEHRRAYSELELIIRYFTINSHPSYSTLLSNLQLRSLDCVFLRSIRYLVHYRRLIDSNRDPTIARLVRSILVIPLRLSKNWLPLLSCSFDSSLPPCILASLLLAPCSFLASLLLDYVTSDQSVHCCAPFQRELGKVTAINKCCPNDLTLHQTL